MAANQPTLPRILLVEDEALIALSEAQMLKRHGYEVVTVHSGEKAIEAVDSDPEVSLILMDIEMGSGMDGTEAAERILEKHSVPIVFLSSHTEPEIVEKTEGITSYGYIVKNSGETVLLTSVKMAFRLHEARREEKRQKENLDAALSEKEKSEDKYRRLVQDSPVGIFQTTSSGQFLHVNPAMAGMVGVKSPTEAISTFQDLSSQVYVRSERRRDFLVQLQKNGCVDQFQLEARRVDGQRRWFSISARISDWNEDGSFVIDGFARDITERIEAEHKHKREAEFREHLLHNIADTIAVTDVEANLTYHTAFPPTTGYEENALVGRNLFEFIHPDDSRIVDEDRKDFLESNGQSRKFEFRFRSASGVYVWLEKNVRKLPEERGEPGQLMLSIRDISERKHREQDLKGMHARLQTVIDSIPFLVDEIDQTGHYIMVNTATCRLLGLSREELIGKHFRDVVSQETAETFQKRIEEVYKSGKQLTVDDRLDVGGKEEVFRTVLSPVIGEDETAQSIVGIAYDISDQLQALHDKDLLMRELNHRVKNHLGMVSSLVVLKDSALGDAVDLSDIKHQIDAIEKVHAALQYSDDITQISLKPYIEDVLSGVFYSFKSGRITVSSRIPNISMKTQAAIALGLIVNEAATNAIQHGFASDSHELCFTVGMERQGENYVLTISNTGEPIPESVDVENPKTLGLQLITALVSQLEGQLEVERGPHPTFAIRFPASQL